MNLGKSISLLILIIAVPALSGCWYAAAAGAGAYGGYKAKEKGYSVQSPVKKDGKKQTAEKKDTRTSEKSD
ncbi:MAG: hypothetical protein PHG91_04670 [Syntrophales bacterium]|nr:hypothetical protein [Syntrophales bacterium]MDD5232669.1 hypothetical protein [Syntrophales bacterium]MDD5533868.1 hypothetical protein [Syntrophales bacterium]HPL64323.1 hypothetical protein [Syntrophales bacterium]